MPTGVDGRLLRHEAARDRPLRRSPVHVFAGVAATLLRQSDAAGMDGASVRHHCDAIAAANVNVDNCERGKEEEKIKE